MTDAELRAYAAALQRAIEHHCRGLLVPDDIAQKCPLHAKKLNGALCAEARRDARRYRALREDRIDDIWVVTGIGTRDYGMSAVLNTFEYSLNGDALDKEIDVALTEGK